MNCEIKPGDPGYQFHDPSLENRRKDYGLLDNDGLVAFRRKGYPETELDPLSRSRRLSHRELSPSSANKRRAARACELAENYPLAGIHDPIISRVLVSALSLGDEIETAGLSSAEIQLKKGSLPEEKKEVHILFYDSRDDKKSEKPMAKLTIGESGIHFSRRDGKNLRRVSLKKEGIESWQIMQGLESFAAFQEANAILYKREVCKAEIQSSIMVSIPERIDSKAQVDLFAGEALTTADYVFRMIQPDIDGLAARDSVIFHHDSLLDPPTSKLIPRKDLAIGLAVDRMVGEDLIEFFRSVSDYKDYLKSLQAFDYPHIFEKEDLINNLRLLQSQFESFMLVATHAYFLGLKSNLDVAILARREHFGSSDCFQIGMVSEAIEAVETAGKELISREVTDIPEHFDRLRGQVAEQFLDLYLSYQGSASPWPASVLERILVAQDKSVDGIDTLGPIFGLARTEENRQVLREKMIERYFSAIEGGIDADSYSNALTNLVCAIINTFGEEIEQSTFSNIVQTIEKVALSRAKELLVDLPESKIKAVVTAALNIHSR